MVAVVESDDGADEVGGEDVSDCVAEPSGDHCSDVVGSDMEAMVKMMNWRRLTWDSQLERKSSTVAGSEVTS